MSAPRLSVLSLLVACDPGNPAPDRDDELLVQVQEDHYREWERPPGRDERRPSTAPHGGHVEIFINAVIAGGLADEAGAGLTAWPDGAVVVLEGYADETTTELAQVAIAEKRRGSWYWEQYQADDYDRPRFSGRPDVCLGCHDTGQDFMRSFALPEPDEEE
jgi:hypothetical protein